MSGVAGTSLTGHVFRIEAKHLGHGFFTTKPLNPSVDPYLNCGRAVVLPGMVAEKTSFTY